MKLPLPFKGRAGVRMGTSPIGIARAAPPIPLLSSPLKGEGRANWQDLFGGKTRDWRVQAYLIIISIKLASLEIPSPMQYKLWLLLGSLLKSSAVR
jgi:hypothetical protein